jgi:hypothetical protein
MIITIIAEPRSGSTNLANWFSLYKDFTIFFEPYNQKSEYYQNKIPVKKWKYNTKYFLIKEIYTKEKNFTELLKISDKVIILYRENYEEQLSSWTNAVITDNWNKVWVFKSDLIKDKNPLYLNEINEIKKGIKEEYLNKNYFNISYEELYYNNGFQKILDYLNITELENKNFPYGQKYRIEKNINKLI